MISEDYKAKMKTMFKPCLSRADLGGKIEIVSLEWLLEMSNPTPSDMVDLGHDRPGQCVDMAELSRDLNRRGLLEPLVVAVGVSTGRARLEAGNHRIGILLDMGFLHGPAVCWVGASHVGFEGNGSHQGRAVKFWPGAKPLVAMGAYDERYFERPSALLPSAPVLVFGEAQAARAPRVASKPIVAERKPRTPRGSKAVVVPAPVTVFTASGEAPEPEPEASGDGAS